MRYLVLIFSLFCSVCYGQTIIYGTVYDNTGEPLPGVNLWIKSTYDGGTSNGEGVFNFTTLKTDSLILAVSAIGYASREYQMDQFSDPIEIKLLPKVNELNAVSITAGTIEVTDKASSVVMRPLDIVTTAGAVGDITGALSTLPGTATVGNDGRLFVRGGDASETAIFFDGLRVGNAYGTTTTNLPTRNRFSPALFKGTFFSTGGYSAEYGDALSSVLVLETIDKPVRNQTDISIMSVGASVSTTLTGKNQSITAEASYQDLSPYQEMVKQNFDWERAPQSYSGQAVYRHRLGKNGIIKGFVQASHNEMVLWQKNMLDDSRGQRIGIKNNYGFGNISYKNPFGDKWLAEGGISLSTNTDQFSIDLNNYQNEENLLHVKQKVTHYLKESLKVKAGAEILLIEYAEIDLINENNRGFNDTRSAIFSEAEWYASTKLTFRGGLRGVHNSNAGDYALEPRFAAAYSPYKKGTVSIAAGRFSQVHTPEIITQAPELIPARADHYQISFQHGNADRILRAEAYYKDYSRLHINAEINPEFIAGRPGFNTEGQGVAKGFDLFFRDRKSIKNTDYWITYSFVHSRRQYADFTSQVQPTFAPEHNFAVVGKYWIAKWKSQPGATLILNSGYSYDNPNMPGEMESLSRAFASLSVNWSYLPRQNLIIHLSLTNVTGRDNVFGHQYASEPDELGFFESRPMRQAAPRFIFIGIFWTISSDKKANQLNNL